MSGYLDKIRPHERRRLTEIDRELFALRAQVRVLQKERKRIVDRASCRVTYQRLGPGYWFDRRHQKSEPA